MGIINSASGLQVQEQPSLLLGGLVGAGPLKGIIHPYGNHLATSKSELC